MTRFIRHWRALPAQNRIGLAVSMLVLIVAIVLLAFQISSLVADVPSTAPPPTPATVQSHLWSKTEPLLSQADRQAALALDKHLASIHTFLEEHKAGSKAFADQLLSLRGKWELVRAGIGNQSDYALFLQQAFAEHLFPMEDLEKAVDAAIRSYLAELESIDNDLLVRLRADLADDDLPRTVIPALRSDQAILSQYHEMRQRVAQDLRTDLAFVAVRELFLWEATNVATDLTMQAGAAIAARMGLSSTILAGGAASTWATLGVGLVAGFVLDAVVNQIMKAAGYDAEEKIARRIEETLSDLGRTITDGDPEARATLEQLKTMQRNDPKPDVRTSCAEAIRSLEAGTLLYGLRRELSKIGAARASLRKETLRRIIHESE